MADVGLGQLATTTGRAISRMLKDAVKDNHPVYEAIDKHGGIRFEDGGRSIVDETKTAQNGTVKWVGESGNIDLQDQKIIDAPEFTWRYQLGGVLWTLAEQYQNAGGRDTKLIDLVSAKYDVLKDSMENEFHGGMNSNGAGSGGLELVGLPGLVATDPTTGTVGGIDRSNASDAGWYRNQKFDTGGDWANGSVSDSNVKAFLDKLINATTRNSKTQAQLGIMGQTHFEHLTSAIGALQSIVNVNGTGKAGFDKLVYRSVPFYFGAGLNYSGESTVTATRTYLLNVKRGGVNLVFHRKAQFDLLEPVNSADQAAVSRLMFTMAAMTIGGLAKTCIVGFD